MKKMQTNTVKKFKSRARPMESYRAARRNFVFGRLPVGNTWPRMPRHPFINLRRWF